MTLRIALPVAWLTAGRNPKRGLTIVWLAPTTLLTRKDSSCG